MITNRFARILGWPPPRAPWHPLPPHGLVKIALPSGQFNGTHDDRLGGSSRATSSFSAAGQMGEYAAQAVGDDHHHPAFLSASANNVENWHCSQGSSGSREIKLTPQLTQVFSSGVPVRHRRCRASSRRTTSAPWLRILDRLPVIENEQRYRYCVSSVASRQSRG